MAKRGGSAPGAYGAKNDPMALKDARRTAPKGNNLIGALQRRVAAARAQSETVKNRFNAAIDDYNNRGTAYTEFHDDNGNVIATVGPDGTINEVSRSRNGRSGGGGYAMPAFDASPFDSAQAGINARSDASKRVIAQMQTELAARLNDQAVQYKAAADKLQADMVAQGQAAQQANTTDLQRVQQDLAQQGAPAQAVAAQAQAQEQARAQAQARQQDYLARLAQLGAANTADRQSTANTMFAGINSQADLLRNQQLGAVDKAREEARAAFVAALAGGGGRSGGGGSRRSSGGGNSDGGGGDSMDPTQSQIWSMNNNFEFNENDPANRFAQTVDLAITPYAANIANMAFTQGYGPALNKWLMDKQAYDRGQKGVFGPDWALPKVFAQNVDAVLDRASGFRGGGQYIVNAPTRNQVLQNYSAMTRGNAGGAQPRRVQRIS